MLVLSRKTNERICIGDNIQITILSVCGNQVRIGIDAPIDITVHREEVYERIQRETLNQGQKNYGSPAEKIKSDKITKNL